MRALRRSVVAVAMLLAASLLGGCAAPDGVVAPTTVESGPTTTAATTSTTVAEDDPCPVLPAPNAAPSTAASVDMDGDGAADVMSTDADQGLVQVELSSGGSARHAFGDVDPVLPVGGVDLDADGGDETWLVAGSGAATQAMVLLDLHECELVPVTPSGGLVVGATVRNASGIGCEDGDGDGSLDTVVHTELSSSDGERYSGTAVRYVMTDDGLAKTSVDEVTASVSSPEPIPLGGFSCGDLRPGQSTSSDGSKTVHHTASGS